MKKRYIDQLAKNDATEDEQHDLLKPLLQQHFDQQTKAKWAAMLKEQGVVREPTLSVWMRYRAAAAIALLVLAASAGWWYWNQSGQDPRLWALSQIELGEPLRLPGNVRGGNNVPVARLPQAYAAYEQKQYPEAIRLLRALPADSLGAPNRLLLGLCYVYLPDYAQAAPQLEAAAEALEGTEREVAMWYGALAQVQLGQTVRARTLLDSLANVSNGLYRAPARDLLRRLK